MGFSEMPSKRAFFRSLCGTVWNYRGISVGRYRIVRTSDLQNGLTRR
ncbi:hypothetical protein RUMCAL_01219 [Ruminococcus callidus ATCC 27760]|uniref:Uncharacterized protein n=1 Tax=Ruminococcus callidus ATCC 27760 TaxID=411473 RepID=U2KVU7_9FIRM|nr:hypothetical protein RUMCAL_01219 [Ruminococcus callidus ATCC 27760]